MNNEATIETKNFCHFEAHVISFPIANAPSISSGIMDKSTPITAAAQSFFNATDVTP
jgi:hypothetical protein